MTAKLPRLRPLEVLHLPDEEGGTTTVLRDPEGFSDEELALSEAALFVAAHFDGEHTLEDALAAFERRYRARPPERQVLDLRDRLEEAGFLETERFERLRRERVEEFERAPVREAAHAGVSYAADPEAARAEVAAFFERAAGLEESGPRPAGALRGLIAPHIDLRLGGSCAALAYRELAAAETVETVIVLGTSHACPHPAWIVHDRPFSTPLGEVPVDEAACRRLAAAATAGDVDRYYHRREHSVEFQALFLAALRAGGRDLRMVPVLCGSLREAGLAGREDPFLEELRGLLDALGRRAVAVAAADLAHVGPRFGDPDPLQPRHLELLERKDRATLSFAAGGDARGFFDAVMEAGDPRRICGLAPITALLTVLPAARGKLLRYEQANDETGTVSYASMGLWEEPGSPAGDG